jgi:hypothetical protein
MFNTAQADLVPVYRDKWWELALSTERIDRKKVTEAIAAIYIDWKAEADEILFLDSLYDFLEEIEHYLPNFEEGEEVYDQLDWLGNLESHLFEQLSDDVIDQLYDKLQEPLTKLLEGLWSPFLEQFYYEENILRIAASNFCHDVVPQYWLVQCSFIDFCVSVLKCSLDEVQQREWEAFQLLAQNSGWVYWFAKGIDEETEDTWVICDRPTKLLVDSENRLHAEGEPAIEFADGFRVYAHHGARVSG